MWQISGPENTGILLIECYLVRQSIIHITTFKLGGYDVLVNTEAGDPDHRVEEVLARTYRGE